MAKFWRKLRPLANLALTVLPAFIPGLYAGKFLLQIGGKFTMMQAAVVLGAVFGGGKKKNQQAQRAYNFPAQQRSLPGAPMPLIYGETVVTPIPVWERQVTSTKKIVLFMLGTGPYESIDQININGYPITSFPGSSATVLLGDARDQTLPSTLDDLGQGLPWKACVIATLEAHDRMGSDPVVTCRVKGRKPADVYSSNPVDVVSDLLTDPLIGAGLTPAKLDTAKFAAAKAHCAATVAGQYIPTMELITGWTAHASSPASNPTLLYDGVAFSYADGTWAANISAVQDLNYPSADVTTGPVTLSHLLTIDLAGLEYVGKLKLFWASPDGRVYRGLKVQYTTNASATVGDDPDPSVGYATVYDSSATARAFRGTTVVEMGGVQARFIKISAARSNINPTIALTELQIFEAVAAPAFQVAAIIEDGGGIGAIMQDVLGAGGLSFSRGSGNTVGITALDDAAPVFAFDETNIVLGSAVVDFFGIPDRPNSIRLTWWDVLEQARKIVVSDSAEGIALDGRRPIEIESLYCPTREQALRLARIASLTSQSVRYTVTLESTWAAIAIQTGDIVTLDLDLAGWTAKPFRVTDQTISSLGNLQFELTEHDPSLAENKVYDWSIDQLNSDFANPLDDLPPITTLALAEGGYRDKDGKWWSVIEVTWDDVRPPYLSAWVATATKGTEVVTVATDEASVSLPVYSTGTWTVEVRPLSVHGVVGSPESDTIAVAGKAALPGDCSSLTAVLTQVGASGVRFDFTKPTDSDVSHYEVRYHPTSTTWASMTRWGDLTIGVRSATGILNLDFTEATPGTPDQITSARTLKVAVKAVDRSGNYSLNAATATVSGTTLPNISGVTPTVIDSPSSGHAVFFKPLDSGYIAFYEIHRSESTGFSPTKDTRVATVPGNYQDATAAVADGVFIKHPADAEDEDTFYYRVVAVDWLAARFPTVFTRYTSGNHWSAESAGEDVSLLEPELQGNTGVAIQQIALGGGVHGVARTKETLHWFVTDSSAQDYLVRMNVRNRNLTSTTFGTAGSWVRAGIAAYPRSGYWRNSGGFNPGTYNTLDWLFVIENYTDPAPDQPHLYWYQYNGDTNVYNGEAMGGYMDSSGVRVLSTTTDGTFTGQLNIFDLTFFSYIPGSPNKIGLYVLVNTVGETYFHEVIVSESGSGYISENAKTYVANATGGSGLFGSLPARYIPNVPNCFGFEVVRSETTGGFWGDYAGAPFLFFSDCANGYLHVFNGAGTRINSMISPVPSPGQLSAYYDRNGVPLGMHVKDINTGVVGSVSLQ